MGKASFSIVLKVERESKPKAAHCKKRVRPPRRLLWKKMRNPRWQPRNGFDGRLLAKNLITTIQVNLCCFLCGGSTGVSGVSTETPLRIPLKNSEGWEPIFMLSKWLFIINNTVYQNTVFFVFLTNSDGPTKAYFSDPSCLAHA